MLYSIRKTVPAAALKGSGKDIAMTVAEVQKKTPLSHSIYVLLILTVLGAAGFISRLALVLGYQNRFGTYLMPALYPVALFFVLVLAGGGTFSRKAFLACSSASLVYVFLCFFFCLSRNALLHMAALLAEIPLYGVIEYLLLRACGREVRMGSLLLKVLFFVCTALAVCRLIARDTTTLQFYLPGTDAHTALRADIMKAVSLSLSLVMVIFFMITFLSEGLTSDVPSNRLFSHVALSILVIFVLLVVKAIFPGSHTLVLGFGSGRGGRVDTQSGKLYYSIGFDNSAESSDWKAEKKPLGCHPCGLYNSQEDWEKKNAFYTFQSAEGLYHVDNLEKKTYVTTLADELILARENSEWTVLLPRDIAGMEKDDELTSAIWEGIEEGHMLLPVNCMDYLLRVDHEKAMEALERWSSGSFTDGEARLGYIYNLNAVAGWAKAQLSK